MELRAKPSTGRRCRGAPNGPVVGHRPSWRHSTLHVITCSSARIVHRPEQPQLQSWERFTQVISLLLAVLRSAVAGHQVKTITLSGLEPWPQLSGKSRGRPGGATCARKAMQETDEQHRP